VAKKIKENHFNLWQKKDALLCASTNPTGIGIWNLKNWNFIKK
jgi:hypothetical protein